MLMKKPKNLSLTVSNVVFGPTMLAYLWISLKHAVAGLTLYVVFLFFAYKMWLFENVKRWPKSSLITLYSGPLLLAIGLYFSTQPYGYAILIPLGVYAALSIAGGLALVGKFNSGNTKN